MATTIDIPCPKCGELVYGDYLKGRIHEFLFLTLMRTSFRVACPCGFKKTYWFLSPRQMAKLYEAESARTPDRW